MSTELTEVNILEAFAQGARLRHKGEPHTDEGWQLKGIEDFVNRTNPGFFETLKSRGLMRAICGSEPIYSFKELSDILVDMKVTSPDEAENFLEALSKEPLHYTLYDFLLVEKLSDDKSISYRIRDISTDYQ